MDKFYDVGNRDIMEQDKAGGYYIRHVQALTAEALHSKSDIAAELAHRDMQLDAQAENLRAARQAHDELVLRLAEKDEIIKEWQPHPTVVVRELVIRIVVATDIFREFLNADFAHPLNPELWARVESWLADSQPGPHNVPVEEGPKNEV